MSFELSAEEQLIVEAVHELAAGPNGRAHWRESALANTFPDRLWQALAEAGYLGLLVPPSASTGWGCRGAIERFPAAARGARAGAPPALPRPRHARGRWLRRPPAGCRRARACGGRGGDAPARAANASGPAVAVGPGRVGVLSASVGSEVRSLPKQRGERTSARGDRDHQTHRARQGVRLHRP